jgi:hypothetical protein
MARSQYIYEAYDGLDSAYFTVKHEAITFAKTQKWAGVQRHRDGAVTCFNGGEVVWRAEGEG